MEERTKRAQQKEVLCAPLHPKLPMAGPTCTLLPLHTTARGGESHRKPRPAEHARSLLNRPDERRAVVGFDLAGRLYTRDPTGPSKPRYPVSLGLDLKLSKPGLGARFAIDRVARSQTCR